VKRRVSSYFPIGNRFPVHCSDDAPQSAIAVNQSAAAKTWLKQSNWKNPRQRKVTSQSGLFNPRIVAGFALGLAGISLAMLLIARKAANCNGHSLSVKTYLMLLDRPGKLPVPMISVAVVNP
jgi:hypothetical protein